MFMTHLPMLAIVVENELRPILPGLASIVCQDDSWEGQRFIKVQKSDQTHTKSIMSYQKSIAVASAPLRNSGLSKQAQVNRDNTTS